MGNYKRVIMAEKRDAGEDIAKAIGLRNIERVGKSNFIHGRNSEGEEVVVVWSNGHCVTIAEPDEIDEKYRSWNVEDLPLPLENDNMLSVIKEKRGLFADIKKELADADNIVNAGDSAREGELIQRWILELALRGKKKDVYRLWVQSLTPSAIKKAYESGLLGTRPEEQKRLDDLYDSGRARAIMDKYIGYNYSRLLSITQTDGVTVNYGRCKSPLVHAIVERDKEIEAFVSEPFSYLEILLEKDEIEFKGVMIDEKRERVEFSPNERAELEALVDSLPSKAVIRSIQKKSKVSTPPLPYDTLQLQKEMSNKYGFDADKTLAIMEELYAKHHILSYPRTDTRYYTTDLKEEFDGTLAALNFGKFSTFVRVAQKGFIPDKYFNDKKIADHHALAPVSEGSIEKIYNQLSEDEKKVYDAVVLNFIALHYPNYEYETTEVIAEAGGRNFRIKGKKDIKLGYKALYPKKESVKEENSDEDSEQDLPTLTEGESVTISSKDIIDSRTKPKSHFTTATLLEYMKRNNIGTGATRDRLIKELTERRGKNADSSVRKEGKYFVSTAFGRDIDSVIPDNLKSIDYLKYLEKQIQDIAEGKQTLSSFIEKMEKDFLNDLSELKQNRSSKLVSNNPGRKLNEDMICPVCGNALADVSWGYSCSAWKKDGSGCNFAIGKKQFNKTLSEKVIKQLLSKRITKDKIKGMKGKSGKSFDAQLSLEISPEGKAIVRPKF